VFGLIKAVMPGQKREAPLRGDVPGIHVFKANTTKNLNGRALPSNGYCPAGGCFDWKTTSPISVARNAGDLAFR